MLYTPDNNFGYVRGVNMLRLLGLWWGRNEPQLGGK